MTTPTRRGGTRLPPSAPARLATRLSRLLQRQIGALEKEPETGYSEPRVKALLLLAKTLQAMDRADSAAGRAGNGDDDSGSGDDFTGGDILELRRKLEKQISALDREGPGRPVLREP